MPRASDKRPPELTVGWTSARSAKYACENWHYAGIQPTGKLVRIGAWENGRFLGALLFSRGASPFLGNAWGLDHVELCELTRVALRDHITPVSQIVARALRMVKESSPGLRLVVSFADPHKDHVGTIYQAGNWIYTGQSQRTIECLIGGRWRHVRGSYHKLKDSGLLEEFQAARAARDEGAPAGIYKTMQAMGRMRIMEGKYRYVYPLDRVMRRRAEKLRQPYPKPAVIPVGDTGHTSSAGRFDPVLTA